MWLCVFLVLVFFLPNYRLHGFLKPKLAVFLGPNISPHMSVCLSMCLRSLGDNLDEVTQKPRLSLPEINVISEDNQVVSVVPIRRKASLPTDYPVVMTMPSKGPLPAIKETAVQGNVLTPVIQVDPASLTLPKSHTVT